MTKLQDSGLAQKVNIAKLVIARSAAAHGELVEPRGNLVEVEHTLANHHCYGTEIANPRIEYGVAMTD